MNIISLPEDQPQTVTVGSPLAEFKHQKSRGIKAATIQSRPPAATKRDPYNNPPVARFVSMSDQKILVKMAVWVRNAISWECKDKHVIVEHVNHRTSGVAAAMLPPHPLTADEC
ncbi:hypothetical protein WA026_004005 [Henosepilachna vigintioctopunctata]|uniref:Uncharacterized protein n=1 Tax=Henosepilachna vigintioctopunctata TaxID=420089 RepID=A0AAW1UG85_9CUCU